MTVQDAMPPYTFRCLRCGAEWIPTRTTAGGLEKESRDHVCGS